MNILKITIGILVLVFSVSCEKRNLKELMEKNKQDVIVLNENLQIILTEYDLNNSEEELKSDIEELLDNFCTTKKCLKIEVIVSCNGKQPLEIQKGNFNLKEIAYIDKENINKENNTKYDVMHGLIYDLDNEDKFKKGSLITSVSLLKNKFIKKVETKVLLEYKRQD